MASGLLGHLQRCFSLMGFESCGDHVAREAAEEIEHALAPRRERILRRQQLARAHDARPLEDREQHVVGIGRLFSANVGLPLEERLHRLRAPSRAAQRLLAPRAQLLERSTGRTLGHRAEVLAVGRVHPLMDLGRQHLEHRSDQRAVHPGVEGVADAAADVAAEKRLLRVAQFQVLGDLPGIAYHVFAGADDRNGLAARKRDRRLVAHAHRTGFELERLVRERHPRAPGEQAVAPVVRAAELPEDDHAALLTPGSTTSWLAGRALMRRSFSSARSRSALRNAWSRAVRYCCGQCCGTCWYQAEAWSVKYGLARCGRASATRSAFPEASRVLTWSGVVTAPTVMVAMPTSFLTQSA